MKNASRMSLAQLVSQYASPRDKLRRSASKTMSRRSVRNRRAKQQLVDLSKHGTVIQAPPEFNTGVLPAAAVAARWLGRDFVITVPWFIAPWRDWSKTFVAGDYIRDMRQGARALSTLALSQLNADFGYVPGVVPYMPKLKAGLESVALARVIPPRGKKFEEDSIIHWCHHMRDGLYDVWAGFKVKRDGKLDWQGQYEDDNNKPGFIPCEYNQVHADGHGVAFVFRFKPEAFKTLQLTA